MPARLTLTVPEVAELLGISRSSAYECVRRGEIPSITLGRRVVIPRRALEALLSGAPATDERVGGDQAREGAH
jgi:excisionase family DNA binding protein